MTRPVGGSPRRPRRRQGRQRGQALVELALTLPLLLLLAVSIFDYGYYLEHVNNIATVVRDGARYASENTVSSPLPWSSACAAPTWSSTSNGWTCAGLGTTIASGSGGVDVTGSAFQDGTATIAVGSVAGFGTDFTVTTTTTSGEAIIACNGTSTSSGAEFIGCGTDVGMGQLIAGNSLIGSSDFTEGVIQSEAESLTVPEGGLPLDNIDCCWSGSSGGSGCPTGSGTIPVLGGTVVTPSEYSWPTGVTAADSPVSCMTISYWNSSDGSFSTSSLSLCGWFSADAADAAATDAQGWQPTDGCVAAPGELVQVTVAYAWSKSSPGPLFTVMNSVLGMNVNVVSTYSLVVAN